MLATSVSICAFCPLLVGQRPPHCAQNLYCLFNQGAATTDPAGIRKYSEDLVRLLVSERAGEDRIRPFSAPLAVTAVVFPPLNSQSIIQEVASTSRIPFRSSMH